MSNSILSSDETKQNLNVLKNNCKTLEEDVFKDLINYIKTNDTNNKDFNKEVHNKLKKYQESQMMTKKLNKLINDVFKNKN